MPHQAHTLKKEKQDQNEIIDYIDAPRRNKTVYIYVTTHTRCEIVENYIN